MIRPSFLTYAIARHNAVELDRRGQRPGLLLRLLMGVASLAVLGLAGCIVFAVAAVGLIELGVIK